MRSATTPLGVRLLPIAACAITSLLVFDLARMAGGSRATCERAAVWYNAMLLVAAGGFLAVPDAPAALFWTFCLWSIEKALQNGRAGWWLAAGVAAGLAGLSKYSALFLGPGVLLWLAWTPAGRASLMKTPGPWLALFVAATLFGLNLGWNASHQWVTFTKQFGRLAPHRLAPRYLVEFLVTEVVLLNPLLAVFLVQAAARRPEGLLARVKPFVATSAPFIAYLLLHSLHDRIQAHWPAPVYPALALCAAFAAEGAGGIWRTLRAVVPWVGLWICVAGALYVAAPVAGVPLRFDPAMPVRGWARFGRDIETRRQANGAAWVGTTSYGLAAELTDQPTVGAPILQIRERQRWRGLKQGIWADTGRPGLLLDLPRRMDLESLRLCFSTVQPLADLERSVPGEKPVRYAVALVSGPRRDVVGAGCAP